MICARCQLPVYRWDYDPSCWVHVDDYGDCNRIVYDVEDEEGDDADGPTTQTD